MPVLIFYIVVSVSEASLAFISKSSDEARDLSETLETRYQITFCQSAAVESFLLPLSFAAQTVVTVEKSPKRWLSTELVAGEDFSAMKYLHTEFKRGRIHRN
jgi:hypothetical protein